MEDTKITILNARATDGSFQQFEKFWWSDEPVSFRKDDNYIEAQNFELNITEDYMNNDLIRLPGYRQ